MSKFLHDLKFGNKYEKECLKYFNYSKFEIKQGKFKPYDILLDDKVKIEVKADRLSYKTGNLVIEFKCSDKDSGITTTEADYWVYFVIKPENCEVYKFEVEELKKLVADCRIVKGGDGYRSSLYLLPVKDLEKYLLT